MCINYSTPYRARRGAVRFRRRFDEARLNKYVIEQGRLFASGTIVFHVAVYSARGTFLTYV